MKLEDVGFIPLLKVFGINRIFKSKDFVLSVFFTVILFIIIDYYSIYTFVIESVIPLIASIAGALLAITIAGYAIIVSSTDREYVTLLHEKNVYKNILFNFYYNSIIALLSILIGIFTLIIHQTPLHSLAYILSILSIFTFLYFLFGVILLFGLITALGMFRAELFKKKII